ncbi:Barstar (barnase inhibitor) [Dyadobacter sp. 32]|uniref:Barstar (barnase inhibitor) n=1 Tax=Dyadobacter sp. 32 TaxID=538966 RepID=UPI0011EBCF09
MNKKTIVINGENFSDLAGCYQEMNSLFMHDTGWKMSHSLDALNDILYGGFGVFEPGEPVVVIWQNFSKSKDALGYRNQKILRDENKPRIPVQHSTFQKQVE